MVIVDVETSGLDPTRHSILSIGAIDFDRTTYQFYGECRIWEGAEVSPEALEVNGFAEEGLHDPSKRSLRGLIEEFHSWVEPVRDKTLAGENPGFDSGFLLASARRCGVRWRFRHRTVDLHSVSYAHHLRRRLPPPLNDSCSALSLDKTLAYVGLPAEERPHNALNGARLEVEAFSRLLFGEAIFTAYLGYPIPEYLL